MAKAVIDGIEWTSEELEVRARMPSPMLAAMRSVMAGQPPASEEERLVKEVRDKSPKQFLEMILEAERDYQQHVQALMAPQFGKVADLGPDEGTERGEVLMDRLLREFEAERAAEDAALSARPDAAQNAGTLQKHLAEALRRAERLQERVDELERNRPGHSAATSCLSPTP